MVIKINRQLIIAGLVDVAGVVVILIGWNLYRFFINAFLPLEIVVDLVVVWTLISWLVFRHHSIRFAWMGMGCLGLTALASALSLSTATYLFSSLAFVFLVFGFLGQLIFERSKSE